MRAVLASLAVLVLAGSAAADNLTFDFSGGIGPNFTIVASDPGWDVRSDTTGLRVSWDSTASGLFPSPDERGGFGGVLGGFSLIGDFSMTVDYALHKFDQPTNPWVLFDSVLAVSPDESDAPPLFEVLRYTTSNGQFIEVFQVDENGNIWGTGGLNSDTFGRYRLSRTGSTISGYFATGNSSTFNFIGSSTIAISEPVTVALTGFYAIRSRYSDPSVSMDISFNNLVIEADQIVGVVPEPASVLLLGGGLGAAVWLRRRPKKAA